MVLYPSSAAFAQAASRSEYGLRSSARVYQEKYQRVMVRRDGRCGGCAPVRDAVLASSVPDPRYLGSSLTAWPSLSRESVPRRRVPVVTWPYQLGMKKCQC